MSATSTKDEKNIFWHRELPPIDAEPVEEHIVEAVSSRVSGDLTRRGELWEACYDSLMKHIAARLQQEVLRLGGQYAHVLSESVDSRHEAATGESWLLGRYTYMLYRRRAR